MRLGGSRKVIALLAVVLVGAVVPPGQAGPAVLQLVSLSNRADLISDGQALVEVRLPEGVRAEDVTVDRDGTDITDAFATRADGRFYGLVDGLALGPNQLTASAPGQSSSRLTIVNHPNGGPVFSGPQIQPWVCQSTAVDAQCNQPSTFSYYYRSTDPQEREFLPYDPAKPAADVATTTTDEGVTLPFIVRVETGYQDRDQYRIGTLFQPGQRWSPWTPQKQWNHKLLITHGGGCGASYGAGGAPDIFTNGEVPVIGQRTIGESPTLALGRGLAVMSTALNNNGHNCNIVVQAESMMMAKERLVENYGILRYTIGTGCSGGALTQQQVANAYPGIYQGLITTCTYPDTLTPGAQFADYHLLRLYFEDPSKWGPGIVWTPTQWAAVEGHIAHVNTIAADEGLFKSAVNPAYACDGTTKKDRYNAKTNPGGVRCSILDYMINVLGPRPEALWSAQEKAIGRGFVTAPFGNEGIQYGLQALQLGLITPAQFVDLNMAIGGFDIDANRVDKRTAADPASIENAYRSGAINSTNNMSTVAIIQHSGPDPGVAHDTIHGFWTRARLDREQGHHRNQIIWFGPTPLIGDPNYFGEALLAMDRWLSSVEGDTSDIPLSDKIIVDKPDDIADRCSPAQSVATPDWVFVPGASMFLGPNAHEALGPEATDVLDQATNPANRILVDPVLNAVCSSHWEGAVLQTRLSTPRGVAGDGPTSDINACTRRPLDRGDYTLPFTDDQWKTLQRVFADGVCDWRVRGIGQRDTVPWLTYEDATGAVRHGGVPLPQPHGGATAGWVSPAFK